MIENRTYYVDNDKSKKINVKYDIDEDELDIITKRATKGEKYLNHKLLCKLLNKINYDEETILYIDFFIGMVFYGLFLFKFNAKLNFVMALVMLFAFVGIVLAIFFFSIFYSDNVIDCIQAVPTLEDINALLSHAYEYKVVTTPNKDAYRLVFNDEENRIIRFKTSDLTLHLDSSSWVNYYWKY